MSGVVLMSMTTKAPFREALIWICLARALASAQWLTGPIQADLRTPNVGATRCTVQVAMDKFVDPDEDETWIDLSVRYRF